MKKRTISGKELTWYLIAGILAFAGLALATMSVIGEYLTVPAADNWILSAETAVKDWSGIPLDWLAWGTIFLGLGLVIGLIALLTFAKRDIAEKEKALRRAQRLGAEVVSTQE